jgi:hypothetical protein
MKHVLLFAFLLGACGSPAPTAPRENFGTYSTIARDGTTVSAAASAPRAPSLDEIDDMLNARKSAAPPLAVDGVTHIARLKVDSLFIGDAILLRPEQGTVYSNGRLGVHGIGRNSSEVALWPGRDRSGRGIVSQIIMHSGSFGCVVCQRTGWSIVDDGGGIMNGTLLVHDSDVYGNAPSMPTYWITGSQNDSRGGTDGSLRYDLALFRDDSDEIYLDGVRVQFKDLLRIVMREHPGEFGCRLATSNAPCS